MKLSGSGNRADPIPEARFFPIFAGAKIRIAAYLRPLRPRFAPSPHRPVCPPAAGPGCRLHFPRSRKPSLPTVPPVVLSRLLAAAVVCAAAGAPSVAAAENPRAFSAELSLPLPGAEPLRFRLVAPGTFVRGSPDTEKERDRDEGPAHVVTLTRPYYLGVFEVTQAQWQAVMGDNPSVFRDDPASPRYPVSSVSWNDTREFIRRLNARGLARFRLPTEAEWEYAARAGTTTRYPWGDDAGGWETHRHAWANSRSYAQPHPVGAKPANPWGFHDLHGNVWEWCADWYGPYAEGPQTDPAGPARGEERVFRGGSWFDFPPALRSANRHRHGPADRYPAIGLRLALDPATVHADRVATLPGGVPLPFLRLPAGSFRRGSPDGEAGRARDEAPLHTVRLSRDLYLGQFEVTQQQWTAVMGTNPSLFADGPEAPQRPVERVDFAAVAAFLARLNALGLGRFRLPTEAEWEYAARAGTTTRFPWGDDSNHAGLRRHGWFNPFSEGRTHPVGTRAPNPWGFFDLAGNVWEWCADWRGDYAAGDVVDPAGPATGTQRVIRGGSWFNEPEALRPANRHAHPETSRLNNLGLRLVLETER